MWKSGSGLWKQGVRKLLDLRPQRIKPFPAPIVPG